MSDKIIWQCNTPKKIACYKFVRTTTGLKTCSWPWTDHQYHLGFNAYPLKLMKGKFTYSESLWCELRRGKVQKKALHNRQATCCWVIVTLRQHCWLIKGIGWNAIKMVKQFEEKIVLQTLGKSIGSCNASSVIFGRVVSKNFFLKSTSMKSVKKVWRLRKDQLCEYREL